MSTNTEALRLVDTTTAAALVAIDGLSTLYRNRDDISAKNAIRAATEDRPAFWSTARYGNQAARNLLDEANNLPLNEVPRLQRGGSAALALIETLIPLNPAAARALADARERL